MKSRFTWLLSLTLFIIIGCVRTKEQNESPFEVAKSYCSCLEEEIKNTKDSLIDTYDCEKKVFSKSRMMQIPYLEDTNKLTRDSSFNFIIEVRNITDTMCINKLDNKLKKRSHIRM